MTAKADEGPWFDSTTVAPGSTGGRAPQLDVESGGGASSASMLPSGVGGAATQLLFQHVKSSASSWKVLIGNIDPLRPYFEVETADVLKRFLYSLVPRPALSSATMVAAPDFYGPLVSAFTAGALLHSLLGGSEHMQGTILGTSLGVCLTYWLVASGFFWTVSYVLDVQLRLQSVVCLTGYAMSGYCATIAAQLLLGNALGGLAVFVAGGLSAASLGMVFYHNHPQARKGLMAAAAVASVHFLFLLWIRYQYFSSGAEVTRAAPEREAPEGKGEKAKPKKAPKVEKPEKEEKEEKAAEKAKEKDKDDKDRLFFF